MDTRWAVVILTAIFGAGRSYAEERTQIHVYVQTNDWTQPIGLAQRIAAEPFAAIGVRLKWQAGTLPEVSEAGPKPIGIRFVKRAPASATPNALAAAQPYDSRGTLINIYQDRVQRLLMRVPSLSDVLLAYILAHELAHVMMGNDYHSAYGIMKAQWSNADYGEMRTRKLSFTDSDAARIRTSLAGELASR